MRVNARRRGCGLSGAAARCSSAIRNRARGSPRCRTNLVRSPRNCKIRAFKNIMTTSLSKRVRKAIEMCARNALEPRSKRVRNAFEMSSKRAFDWRAVEERAGAEGGAGGGRGVAASPSDRLEDGALQQACRGRQRGRIGSDWNRSDWIGSYQCGS